MVFTSEVFLFIFLPMVIGLYFLSRKLKNIFLLAASLFFYAWGEPVYILLMLLSIICNYMFGIIIDALNAPSAKRTALAASIVVNLAFLAVFKYAGFVVANLNALGMAVADPGIGLPIGISFYTFQCMSYVADVYGGGGCTKEYYKAWPLCVHVSTIDCGAYCPLQ